LVNTLTVASLSFVTTRSGFPSPLRSPARIAFGKPPVPRSCGNERGRSDRDRGVLVDLDGVRPVPGDGEIDLPVPVQIRGGDGGGRRDRVEVGLCSEAALAATVDAFGSTLTPSAPRFATARSGASSPSKSATATAAGSVPTGNAWKDPNVPSPSPSATSTTGTCPTQERPCARAYAAEIRKFETLGAPLDAPLRVTVARVKRDPTSSLESIPISLPMDSSLSGTSFDESLEQPASIQQAASDSPKRTPSSSGDS